MDRYVPTGSTYRVGISGSYGGMNLGDEAILQVIIHELRRRLPVSITVFSLKPEDTLARHSVERAVAVRQLSRNELTEELRNLDLFVLGGGGLLYDNEATTFLRPVQIALDLGIPVMTWSIGAGPLHDRHERETVRDVLNHIQLVTVRDERSRLLLEEIDVTQDMVVTADPGILLEPQPFTEDMLIREGLSSDHRLIGLSIREPGPAAPDLAIDHYHELLANTVDYLVDRLDATVLFIPMERQTDLQHAHAVVARVANVERAFILKGDYSSSQIRGLMQHLAFAIGMRLHFLIFATSAEVPFVPLPYGSKVAEFVSGLGLLVPPIQSTNSGQLLAYVDRSWDMRRELQHRLAEYKPALIDRATRTADLAAELVCSIQSGSAGTPQEEV